MLKLWNWQSEQMILNLEVGVVMLTVAEKVGEAKDEANERSGDGKEREELHSWLMKQKIIPFILLRCSRKFQNLETLYHSFFYKKIVVFVLALQIIKINKK